tara:strand:- start:21357 stop:21542 length:186 start_codon:yes stop_codon:yes gene_type:complete
LVIIVVTTVLVLFLLISVQLAEAEAEERLEATVVVQEVLAEVLLIVDQAVLEQQVKVTMAV